MKQRTSLTANQVLTVLRKHYRPPATYLHFRTPLDLLVAVILSARCTDATVNRVTSTIIFPKYRKPEDYVRAKRSVLERDVHSCGTFRTKAKHIQETCHLLIVRHSGKVPRTMEELTALPGVGRKTAAIVLSAAFGIEEGVAVDTHVARLSIRLGLSTHRDPLKIERDLMAAVPRKHWGKINTYLIAHGRAVCTARKPKCGACVFGEKCPKRGMTD